MNSSITLLIGAAVIAVISIPLILKIVPPNPIYGFRTPSTMANPALWYRVNAFAGWALLIAALTSGFLVWGTRSGALPPMAPEGAVFALPVLLAVAASFVYLQRIKSTYKD